MTAADERREALAEKLWERYGSENESNEDFYDVVDEQLVLVESWIAAERKLAYADGWQAATRATADRIRARADENQRWLLEEIITDDGFAQQIGLSVVSDFRQLAREEGAS